jgi:glycosyltransferase involved in cell wall biosynthesis
MKPLLLYVTDSDGMGGAEGYLQTLIGHADRERFRVGLMLPERIATGPLVAAARALDTQIVFFNPIHRSGLSLRVIAQAAAVLRKLRPTIIHFNLPAPRRSAEVMIAAALMRVPRRIATFQLVGSIPPFGRIAGWARRLNRRLQYHSLHRGITVSEGNRQLLIGEYGFPDRRLTLIRNAVDTLHFCPNPDDRAFRTSFGMPADVPLIGMAARLTATKGQAILLAALPLIWATNPHVHVALAGAGDQEAELRLLAASLLRPEQVHFLGALADVRPFLAALDLFVLPSLVEGLPFAVLEAMAMQRAVVAAAVGGTPEAVVDGVTGLLVAPANSSQLASAINRVLSEPALRERMGRAGRERVLAQFDQRVMLERTFGVYDER